MNDQINTESIKLKKTFQSSEKWCNSVISCLDWSTQVIQFIKKIVLILKQF